MSSDSPLQTPEPAPPRERRGPGVVGPLAVLAALISALVTFMILTGRADIEPTEETSRIAILVNFGFVALLVVIIVWEIRGFVMARWRAQAGSQLHGRLVALFSIVAVAPAALLAVFALVTIDKGFDSFFSTRVREIVDNSLVVARAYLNEHARSIRGEILAMANDVNRARPLFDKDRARFAEFFTAQATIRGLPEAQLINPTDLSVVERAKIQIGRDFPKPPAPDVQSADADEPILLAPGKQNAIGAILKLSAYDDLVLFVARPVDPRANSYMRLVEQGSEEYNALTLRRPRIQATFALLYVLLSLSLLLAAIWLGLAFANRLVAPIRRLITAADQVSQAISMCRCRSPTTGGRPRRARRDLQQDDGGASHPAQQAGGGGRADGLAPPLHRGDARGRLGRRHRHRFLRLRHADEPLRRAAHRRARGDAARPPTARGSAGVRAADRRRARPLAAAGAGPDHHP